MSEPAFRDDSGLYLPARLVEERATLRALELLRQEGPPVLFAPPSTFGFRGLGNQPSPQALLAELRGWAAIACDRIADRLQSLRAHVFVSRRVTEGTTRDEQLDDHPAELTMQRPNPIFSWSLMQRLLAMHLLVVGEAYWQKLRDGLGVVRELWPMPPQFVVPVIDAQEVIGGYIVTDGEGRQITLPRTEVIRFWRPDPESLYTARGVLAPQATAHDALSFLQAHLRDFFGRDAVPRVVLTAGKDARGFQPSEKENFYADWRDRYAVQFGRNRGLPAFLPTGYDVKELQGTEGGAALVPLDERLAVTELAAFGVPGSIAGLVQDVNRAAAETNHFVFDQNTILPITELEADALTEQWVRPDFDPRLFVQFEAFVAPDKDFELRREESDTRNKVRSPRQILRDRGANPEDAPWGEFPAGSIGDAPYTGEDPNPPEAPADLAPPREAPAPRALELEDPLRPALARAIARATGPDRAALGALLRAAPELLEEGPLSTAELRAAWVLGARAGILHVESAGNVRLFTPDVAWERLLRTERTFAPAFAASMMRVFETQRRDVVRRLRQLVPRARVSADDLFNPQVAVRAYAVVEKVRRRVFTGSGKDSAELLGATFSLTDQAVAELEQLGRTMQGAVDDVTRRRIARSLSEGTAQGESVDELAKRLSRAITDPKRAKTIARTEVGTAHQRGQLESFRQSGVVPRKRWNTSRDDAVRDSHEIDGQEVALEDDFELANGARCEAPLDPQLEPEDRVNCRCFVTPVTEE